MPRGEKKKKERRKKKKKGETDLQKETGVCLKKKSAKQDINKLDLWKQK